MLTQEIVRLYDKDKYIGNVHVYTNPKGTRSIIIEASDKVNPAEYTASVFEFIRSFLDSNRIQVYLDLSNLYGINNSGWLYEWLFKMENDQITETNFVRINDWAAVTKKDFCVLNDYFFRKFRLFKQNIFARKL